MKINVLILFLFICTSALTQLGGESVYSFLDLNYSARSGSLGRDYISVVDEDINLGVLNPSLLNFSMHNKLSFNTAFMPSGINYGMLAYGRKLGNGFNTSYSLRYVNYGKQIRTDYLGNSIGEVNPSDFVAGFGMNKILNPRISVGGNVNLIYSQLAQNSSLGLVFDLAGTYYDPTHEFLVTAMYKNVGFQMTTYDQESRSSVPSQFQLAVSKKLENAPFRFTVLFHHLNRWDISYFDPNEKPKVDPLTNDTIAVSQRNFLGKFAQHLTIQSEITVSKNLFLRFAYDFDRSMQLKLTQRGALSGLSLGMGFKFKRFSLDYGFLINSAAGYNNLLSLNLDLEKFRK